MAQVSTLDQQKPEVLKDGDMIDLTDENEHEDHNTEEFLCERSGTLETTKSGISETDSVPPSTKKTVIALGIDALIDNGDIIITPSPAEIRRTKFPLAEDCHDDVILDGEPTPTLPEDVPQSQSPVLSNLCEMVIASVETVSTTETDDKDSDDVIFVSTKPKDLTDGLRKKVRKIWSRSVPKPIDSPSPSATSSAACSTTKTIVTQSKKTLSRTKSSNASNSPFKPSAAKLEVKKTFSRNMNNTFKVGSQTDSRAPKPSVTLTKLTDNKVTCAPTHAKVTGKLQVLSKSGGKQCDNNLPKAPKTGVSSNDTHLRHKQILLKPVAKKNTKSCPATQDKETPNVALNSLQQDPKYLKAKVNTNFRNFIKSVPRPKMGENHVRTETVKTPGIPCMDQLPAVTADNDIITIPDTEETNNIQPHKSIDVPENTPQLKNLPTAVTTNLQKQMQEKISEIVNSPGKLAKVVREVTTLASGTLTNGKQGNVMFLLYPVDEILKDANQLTEDKGNVGSELRVLTVPQPDDPLDNFIPDPSATFTPIDINQIINQGKQPFIKSRCGCELTKSEEIFCRGFKKQDKVKPLCLQKLPSFIKEDMKKINVLKREVKKRDQCNFVQCSVAQNDYYLPEPELAKIEVKQEPIVIIDDDETPTLPTLASVISKAIKTDKTKKSRLSDTEKALELIKQGLEIIQNISKEEVEEPTINDTKPVLGNRKRTATKKFSEYAQQTVKKARVARTSSQDKNDPVSSGVQTRRRGRPKNNNIVNIPENKLNLLEDDDDLLIVKRVAIVSANGKSRGRPKKIK